jgi:hypothetical protein
MKNNSRPKHTIQYAVHCADWEIDEDNSPWDDSLPLLQQQEAVPSDKIDERTVRARLFKYKKQAIAYAEQVIKNRKDDKWLAYVEVKRCETRVIKKLK